ncbi:alpha/beta hydrolase [Gracilibacillus sp. S3-1-1]|uniref:Alpha/beta hydrolase n=1 Tax=Gracilibacillus pellucidus TaxID=3095368 RepID=A0ACC6M6X1_9BACI|nr:alpha/beta hydrolase [Gracilibacillus sp. S3-1-1]MDX8046670.1 alpha/beta hydrolase [Gracilibacillus sp. S3-1-1]
MIVESKDKVYFSKEFVEVDGHRTGLFIESTDFANPVLLFLHGGPGYPEYALIKNAGLRWEEEFTVCYLEQRGTGISYNASTQGELTLEQMIADTISVVEYVKQKYNKEKVYLMGHSWGSLLGSIIASRYPHLFHAYIGVGQFGRFFESNRDTYQFLLETAINNGDDKAEKDIRSVTFDEGFYQNKEYRRILNRYVDKYGGGVKRAGYTQWQGMKELLSCKKYTLKERLNIVKGVFTSYQALVETMNQADATLLASEFEIPVYIMNGKHDYQTSFNEAKRFYEKLKAPLKRFYTFEKSAHSPFIDEEEKFIQIIKHDIIHTNGK